jgi:3-phenylpropionate/trans-cinnamate dioxygenase ferredoxin subunit
MPHQLIPTDEGPSSTLFFPERPDFGRAARTSPTEWSENMAEWIDVCATEDIEVEDVVRFDHGVRTFAVYRNDEDVYFCTDGLCTHEQVHLSDGLVLENTIECPKHSSIFDFTTGEVETPPACENLRTYPTRVENGRVLIEI